MSSFKKYLYPIKFAPEKIITLSGTDSFIYLEKNENNEKYSIQFDFEDVKVCLKLSEQSLESEVKFYDNTDIPITLRGLQYERLFTKKVYKVELISENAFIEFIKYNKQDLELKDESIKDYELKENEKIAIIIKKTVKDFYFGLESTNEFTFSFSYGFTIKQDENDHYFYLPNLYAKLNPIKENGIYKTKIFSLNTPFKNHKYNDYDEIFTVNIIIIDKTDKIKLTYGQKSQIDELLDEELEETYCENVISNLIKVFDAYVYTDIAKRPPDIKDYTNYHHEKIDLKGVISKVERKNRKFYEFYQEIKKILTSTKDLHFNVELTKYKNKNNVDILFNQYNAFLPFDFTIKEYKEKEFRVFIEINYINYQSYIEDIQNIIQIENLKKFLEDHSEIPIKSINNMDPFDYIQNWNKFGGCKNFHAEFVNIIKTITNFYLNRYPVNYTDINLNEYEFEDDKFIRLPYKVIIPNKDNKIFNEYFDNYVKNFKSFHKLPSINVIKINF